VPAAGWLVADLDTGDVLAAHDAHGAYAPASTLKILTALTVIPKLPPATPVLVNTDDVTVDGTRVGIVPGHRYTVATLLQGMLMVSGNDAALALARTAGGVSTTVAAMNAEAAVLQADDTHAATVDGLDAPGQVSSAYDLALLTRAALALPTFRTDVGTDRVEFAGAGVTPFQIANHNPLLGAVAGVYGVKNGYTNAARASYVGTARRSGHDLVVVVMRTVPDFVPESKALFDWGFAADGSVAPVGTLVGPAGSAGAQAVPAAAILGNAAAVRIPRGHRFGNVAWLAVGVTLGVLVLLFLVRREQVRRRRRVRLERRLRL
jgi:D-alanyl-D-alanine carboxypeptidase (penicillin-binding protein 5/6)